MPQSSGYILQISRTFDQYSAFTCFLAAFPLAQTVVENDLAVIGAVAQRYSELINSVISPCKCAVGVGRCGRSRAAVKTTRIRIGVNIGVMLYIIRTGFISLVLGSDRFNTGPDRIAGSLPVVLTEISAAIEVSVYMITPCAWCGKVNIIIITFNSVVITVDFIRIITVTFDEAV